MPTLQIGPCTIPYRLRRSGRARRLRMTVRADGIDVTAPLRTGTLEIGAFVERHRDWLLAKVSALRQTFAGPSGAGAARRRRPHPAARRVGRAARARGRRQPGERPRGRRARGAAAGAHARGRARGHGRGRAAALAEVRGAGRCAALGRAPRAAPRPRAGRGQDQGAQAPLGQLLEQGHDQPQLAPDPGARSRCSSTSWCTSSVTCASATTSRRSGAWSARSCRAMRSSGTGCAPTARCSACSRLQCDEAGS